VYLVESDRLKKKHSRDNSIKYVFKALTDSRCCLLKVSKGSKGNDATLYAVSKLHCMSTPVQDESEVDSCCHFVAHSIAACVWSLNLAE